MNASGLRRLSTPAILVGDTEKDLKFNPEIDSETFICVHFKLSYTYLHNSIP